MEVSTEVVKAQSKTEIERAAKAKLIDFLKKYERSFKEVIPKHLSADRFAWLIINNIRKTPALAGVTPMSFINSVMLAGNLGLEIRQNSAYLVPFGKECQLLIDYRGKLDLIRRAGCGAVDVQLVRAADEFDLTFTAQGRNFTHVPLLKRNTEHGMVPVDDEERGEVVLGYATAALPRGGHQFEVMTINQIEAVRRRSRNGYKDLTLAQIRKQAANIDAIPYKERTPWLTDWDQMGRKTLCHRLCNYLPQTPELLQSQEIDTALDLGQPMPLADALADFDIDPADDRPMTEASQEEQDRVRDEKLAQARARPGEPPPPTEEEMQAATMDQLRKEGQLPLEPIGAGKGKK